MKEFTYVIKEELGLHARPAGLLVKEAKKFQSFSTKIISKWLIIPLSMTGV